MRSTGLFLVAFATLARTASADCTKDTDCKGDRVCTAGQCVSPPPPPSAQSAQGAPVAPPVGQAEVPVYTPVYTQPVYNQPVYPPGYPPPGYAQPVYVQSPPASAFTPGWHYAHPGMRRAGIGLFITGAVIDLAGTITFILGANGESTYCASGNSGCQNGADAEEVGEVLWGVGGAITLTGIILWASGASVVPGPAPTETSWLSHVTPYASPTKNGGRAGVAVTF